MTIVLTTLDPNKTYLDQKKFNCGNEKIDKFVRDSLKAQVRKNLSVAYVLTDSAQNDKFVGFFTIAQHSIDMSLLAELQLGSLPRHIPCSRLIMLGVDQAYKGQGLGRQLMRQAFIATKAISQAAGCYGMYLDADPNPRTLVFYEKLGFVFLEGNKSPADSPMFIPITSIP